MEIHVLSSDTVNKIAAGEVVERPVNVVKELIENAIDAGSTAVTCEIRDGGISLIRVTDNGCGIETSQIARAFQRHATSKINDAADLTNLSTLGFRGEALSSIAAVSEVEMITKVRGEVIGAQAVNTSLSPNEDGTPSFEIREVGAPDGTTIIVRNLFYNVPVRRRFLHTAQTEGGYIADLVEHLCLSHPDISFHFRMNGKDRLHTSGNGKIKELIYRIYGRDIAARIVPLDAVSEDGSMVLKGFLGKPDISRSSRTFETFFVNGRYLTSDILSKSLEQGYGTDLMQHQFPFAVLYLQMDPSCFDVNVHPAKKEVRFSDSKGVYDFIRKSVFDAFFHRELIPESSLLTEKEQQKESRAESETAALPHIESFEHAKQSDTEGSLIKAAANISRSEEGSKSPAYSVSEVSAAVPVLKETSPAYTTGLSGIPAAGKTSQVKQGRTDLLKELMSDPVSHKTGRVDLLNSKVSAPAIEDAQQTSLFIDSDEPLPEKIVSEQKLHSLTVLGQVFDTYWLACDDEKLLMIDQHAAHEKVRYERLMKIYREKDSGIIPSQNLMPPIIVSFTGKEEAAYLDKRDFFTHIGFEMEDFGGSSYAIRAVPLELYGTQPEQLLRDIIDEILQSKLSGDPADILARIASMSCKSAVKGNTPMRPEGFRALLDELLTLDNPYHCPHGRPTMITVSKQEFEKKFKRIV